MNLDLYGYITLLTPIILFHFCIDYLGDSQITHSETKIGMYQFFHHIVCTIFGVGTLILPFVTTNINVVAVSIITSLIIQIGFLKNKEYCWLTRLTNVTINKEHPKRKWVGGDLESLIKKYTRGDEWAYSDIRNPDNNTMVNVINLIHLFMLVKINVAGKVR